MLSRKRSLAFLSAVAVASALLQGPAFAGMESAGAGFISAEAIAGLTAPTFDLQASASTTHIAPLLAAPDLSLLAFDGNVAAELAPGTNDGAVSEWDYLWNATASIPISAVPEPTTTALLLVGAGLIAARRLRQQRK